MPLPLHDYGAPVLAADSPARVAELIAAIIPPDVCLSLLASHRQRSEKSSVAVSSTTAAKSAAMVTTSTIASAVE
jgi:hypothetical protein